MKKLCYNYEENTCKISASGYPIFLQCFWGLCPRLVQWVQSTALVLCEMLSRNVIILYGPWHPGQWFFFFFYPHVSECKWLTHRMLRSSMLDEYGFWGEGGLKRIKSLEKATFPDLSNLWPMKRQSPKAAKVSILENPSLWRNYDEVPINHIMFF